MVQLATSTPRPSGHLRLVPSTGTSATASTIDGTWEAWNSSYTYVTTSAASATLTNATNNPVVWTAWNGTWASSRVIAATNSSVTTSTATTWTDWNRAYARVQASRGPTPEERAQMEARRREAERQRREEEAARKVASTKAEQLLEAHLSERQVEQLRRSGWFDVTVHSRDGSRRTYRVHRGRAGNVYLVDDQGKSLRRYCIHPIAPVPDADTMLAQKLLLENDEELFLRTANMTRVAA